ncbi:unnamed protein product [Amoebophrya sp. A25]|nr:unnamed protein product [Amoebophrya sp. A25]|eukprot:GSA25T00007658001.1
MSVHIPKLQVLKKAASDFVKTYNVEEPENAAGDRVLRKLLTTLGDVKQLSWKHGVTILRPGQELPDHLLAKEKGEDDAENDTKKRGRSSSIASAKGSTTGSKSSKNRKERLLPDEDEETESNRPGKKRKLSAAGPSTKQEEAAGGKKKMAKAKAGGKQIKNEPIAPPDDVSDAAKAEDEKETDPEAVQLAAFMKAAIVEDREAYETKLLREVCGMLLPTLHKLIRLGTSKKTESASQAKTMELNTVECFGILPLQATKCYLELLTIKYIPMTLPVEDIHVDMVQSVKQIFKQLLQCCYDYKETNANRWGLEFDAYMKEELEKASADVLVLLHEYVERRMRAMPSALVEQLIVLTVGVFYYCATTIRLCDAAEKLVCSFFSRVPDLRQSVFQEVLGGVSKIPHKKTMRKEFVAPSTGLTVWTRLWLRLFQCACNPFDVAASFDSTAVTRDQLAAQWQELQRMATGFVHKFLKNLFRPSTSKSRALSDEHKELLEHTIHEIIDAAHRLPDLPVACFVLETFEKLLRFFSTNKDYDASVRDLSCKMLALTIASWHREVRSGGEEWEDPYTKKMKTYSKQLQQAAEENKNDDLDEFMKEDGNEAEQARGADGDGDNLGNADAMDVDQQNNLDGEGLDLDGVDGAAPAKDEAKEEQQEQGQTGTSGEGAAAEGGAEGGLVKDAELAEIKFDPALIGVKRPEAGSHFDLDSAPGRPGSPKAGRSMKMKQKDDKDPAPMPTEYEHIHHCCWRMYDAMLEEKPALYEDVLTEEMMEGNILWQHQLLILRHLATCCGQGGRCYIPPKDLIEKVEEEEEKSKTKDEKQADDKMKRNSAAAADDGGDNEDDILAEDQEETGGSKMKKGGPMKKAAAKPKAKNGAKASKAAVKKEEPTDSAEQADNANAAAAESPSTAKEAEGGSSSSTTKNPASQVVAKNHLKVGFRDCVIPPDHEVFARSFLICYWLHKNTEETQSFNDALLRIFADGLDQPGSVANVTERRTIEHIGLISDTVSTLFKKAVVLFNRTEKADADFRSLMQCGSSPLASLRRTAINGMNAVFKENLEMITDSRVVRLLDVRLTDESSWVRTAALDLIGNFIELEDEDMRSREEYANMLATYYKAIRERINDTSTSVRRKSCQILAEFIVTNREHPDVAAVAVELLRRSRDNLFIKGKVIEAFVSLWFPSDEQWIGGAGAVFEITTQMCKQFSYVVYESVQSGIDKEFFQQLINSSTMQVHGDTKKSMISSWATKVFECFCNKDNTWEETCAYLVTMQSFSAIQPDAYAQQLKGLTLYVRLDKNSTDENVYVATQVCYLMANVFESNQSGRSCYSALNVPELCQFLRQMILLQPMESVVAATTCLCAVVKVLGGDWDGLIWTWVEMGMKALWTIYVSVKNKKMPETQQCLVTARLMVLLSTIAQNIKVDEADGSILSASRRKTMHASGCFGRKKPRTVKQGSDEVPAFAKTLKELLLALYEHDDERYSPVVLPCLGRFLMTHRQFAREKLVQDAWRHALQHDTEHVLARQNAKNFVHDGEEQEDAEMIDVASEKDDEDDVFHDAMDDEEALQIEGAHSAPIEAEHARRPKIPRLTGDAKETVDAAKNPKAGSSSDASKDSTSPPPANGAEAPAERKPSGGLEKVATPRPGSAQRGSVSGDASRGDDPTLINLLGLERTDEVGFDSATGFRPDAWVRRGIKSLLDLLVYFGDAANKESDIKFTDADKSDRKGQCSAAESSSPLQTHLDNALTLLFEHPDNDRRRDATGIIRELHNQGLLNPMNVFPRLVGLCFEIGEVPKGATDLATQMLQSRPQMLLSRVADCLSNAFLTLLRSEAVYGGQDDILPTHFVAMSQMYQDFQKKKGIREPFLKALMDQVASIGHKESWDNRFPQFKSLEAVVIGKLTERVPEWQDLPRAYLYRALFVQFVCCVIGALPFQHEAEPLFLVYHITRWTTLHADSKVSQYEQAEGKAVDKLDLFSVTVSSAALTLLKKALKEEYNLTDDRCREYEPNENKVDKGGRTLGGVGDKGDETQGASGGLKIKFPLPMWKSIAEEFSVDAEKNVSVLRQMAEREGAHDVNVNRITVLLNNMGEGGKRTGKGRGRKKANQPAAEVGEAPASGNAEPQEQASTGNKRPANKKASMSGSPQDFDMEEEVVNNKKSKKAAKAGNNKKGKK